MTKSAKKQTQYRYNLVMPQAMHDQLQGLADEHDKPVVEVIRQFIRLGFLVQSGKVKLVNHDGHEAYLVL